MYMYTYTCTFTLCIHTIVMYMYMYILHTFMYMCMHVQKLHCTCNPSAPSLVSSQAFYRRAESLKKLVLIPEMKSTIKAMAHVMPSLFLPQSDPYYQLVWDFVQCFQLQDNPEPKIICDALMVAVDNGM